MKKFILCSVLLASLHSYAETKLEYNYNVRFSPILALIAAPNVAFDFKLNDNWVLSPEFAYVNIEVTDAQVIGAAASLSGIFSFSGAFRDSWYLGGRGGFFSIEGTDENWDGLGTEVTGKASGFSMAALWGYQWFWQTFNINLGLNIAYSTIGEVELKDSAGTVRDEVDTSGIGAGIDFKIGWLF